MDNMDGAESTESADVIYANNSVFPVQVRKRRVKYARARLKNGIVVVTMPEWLDKDRSMRIYEKLKLTVKRAIERKGISSAGSQLHFHDGQILDIMGRSFTISITHSSARRSSASASTSTSGSIVRIRIADATSGTIAEKHADKLAIMSISKAMLSSVESRVMELNKAHFNANIGKVHIRDNSTLWGSYSPKSHSISINFKLLLAPQDVMDYVIIHELAHTKVHNHSKRFYDLVSSAMPDYKDKKKWLRTNGSRISIR